MTDARTNLIAAEADATAARERLATTIAQLQARLDPQALASDARRVGLSVAQTGVAGARRHPGSFAAAVAVAGLYLGRHRVAALFRRRTDTANDPLSIHREGMRP